MKSYRNFKKLNLEMEIIENIMHTEVIISHEIPLIYYLMEIVKETTDILK